MSEKTVFLKRKVPFYYQNRAHGSCGPLSICMVVDSYRSARQPRVSFTEYEYLIRKLMDSNIKGGVYPHKIPTGLEYFDMNYEILKGDLDTKLDNIREAIKEDCPVILHVHDSFAGRRRGHYVVAVGYDAESLFFNDLKGFGSVVGTSGMSDTMLRACSSTTPTGEEKS